MDTAIAFLVKKAAELCIEIMEDRPSEKTKPRREDIREEKRAEEICRTWQPEEDKGYKLDEARVMELVKYMEEAERLSEEQRITINICKETEGVTIEMAIPNGKDCRALKRLISQSDDMTVRSSDKAVIMSLWYGVYLTADGRRVEFLDE